MSPARRILLTLATWLLAAGLVAVSGLWLAHVAGGVIG